MDRIEIKKDIFLHNTGALHIPSLSLAAISDLHIGYESSEALHGPFPGDQWDVLTDKVERVLSSLSPEILVIVGDLKHNFQRNLSQEWDDVDAMLEKVSSMSEVVVVRGNHDNYLSSILRKKGIPLLGEYRRDGLLFAHGHKRVQKEGLLIMGHEHPSVGLRDGVGGRLKLPCFLYSDNHEVVVLPAMSPLAGGADVLRSSEFLSPILNSFSKDGFRVWALSDIGLLSFGKLGALRRAIIEQ